MIILRLIHFKDIVNESKSLGKRTVGYIDLALSGELTFEGGVKKTKYTPSTVCACLVKGNK